MVIDFSISNYCSFDEIQTLSFKATGLDSINKKVDKNNIINADGNRYLKIVGTYGANASGKTNFIKAVAFFREMVVSSVVAEGYAEIGVNPFRQSQRGKEEPSYFQVILLLQGKKFRLGFTLSTKGEIESEWLFGPAEKNETFYFKRKGKDIQVNAEWFPEGTTLPEENLRPDALFLSFCSSYNGPISKLIRSYISNITIEAKNVRRNMRRGIGNFGGEFGQTNKLIENGNEQMVLTWLKEVGLIYNSIRLPEEGQEFSRTVLLAKNIYDVAGNIVGETEMNLNIDESEGTKKFYIFIGKLYRKFTGGGLYVCDEIDSNFHPSLLQKIIKLFQNQDINKANAQLLFTSHDTNLMDPCIMRRDQFYFSEKTMYDATKLYSLADLKGIRNNADFARQYLAGFYGALPVLGDFLEEMETEKEGSNNKID